MRPCCGQQEEVEGYAHCVCVHKSIVSLCMFANGISVTKVTHVTPSKYDLLDTIKYLRVLTSAYHNVVLKANGLSDRPTHVDKPQHHAAPPSTRTKATRTAATFNRL
jgi:hypothetical protein